MSVPNEGLISPLWAFDELPKRDQAPFGYIAEEGEGGMLRLIGDNQGRWIDVYDGASPWHGPKWDLVTVTPDLTVLLVRFLTAELVESVVIP